MPWANITDDESFNGTMTKVKNHVKIINEIAKGSDTIAIELVGSFSRVHFSAINAMVFCLVWKNFEHEKL